MYLKLVSLSQGLVNKVSSYLCYSSRYSERHHFHTLSIKRAPHSSQCPGTCSYVIRLIFTKITSKLCIPSTFNCHQTIFVSYFQSKTYIWVNALEFKLVLFQFGTKPSRTSRQEFSKLTYYFILCTKYSNELENNVCFIH